MDRISSSDFFTYWREVQKYSLPSEPEIALLFQNKETNEVPSQVILGCLKLVCNVVYKMRHLEYYGVQLLDLTGSGNCALLAHLHRYSSRKGRFVNFVTFLVRAYIRREIERHLNYSGVEARKRLNTGLDINPTDSLDKVISDDGEDGQRQLKDVLFSDEDRINHITLDVNNLLTSLRKQHSEAHRLAADVVELRYGVGRRRFQKPLSLSETAAVLQNISKEGVRKIEGKTLSLLRAG